MRKCLGVLVAGAVLCVMSWAQAPASAPPAAPAPAQTPAPASTPPSEPTPVEASSSSTAAQKRAAAQLYPRIEWFAGYTHGQMGLFNSGHWAQLNGWNASLGLNAASWMGLVVEGSQYFGTSKIPTLVPDPFPPCEVDCPNGPTFNVTTKAYNVLFGLQFPYRKHTNWVPFGEVMFGHGGVRGLTNANGLQESEVSSGLALLAGAGLDHPISPRLALRVKCDYLQTSSSFPSLGHQKQDNLRISVGVVIRNVHKKKRKLEDETEAEP